MASFHSFADMSALGNQNATDSFGDKSADIFRLTSGFNNTSDTKAFAVVTGTILLQEVNATDDPSGELVNLILKPFYQAKVEFTPVKYFIYRGLKKSDFITGNLPSGTVKTSGTEFINTIQAIQTQRNTDLGLSDLIPLESLFGYNLAPSGTELIDEFFYNTSVDGQLAPVSIGTYLGNFKTGKCGFEIVLENPSHFPDIDMGQKLVNEITGASGSGIDKRHLRETVLHYIDPAAYYGMHLEENLKVGNKTGTSAYSPATDDINGDLIYENIVKFFSTSNTVYLDIRDTNGNSLNYYENYDGESGSVAKELKLAIDPGPAVPVEYYGSNGWPFHIITDPGNTTVEGNTFHLALPLNENPAPLVYIDHGSLTGGDAFVDTSVLLNSGSNTDWTDDFTFHVPNNLSLSTSEKQIATVVKLHYIRTIHSDAVSANVVPTDSYRDAIFGPINVTPLWDSTSSTKWISGFHKKYVDASTKGGEIMFDIRKAATISGSTFTISGNHTANINNGDSVTIDNATDSLNDGVYTVSGVVLNGSNTEITVTTAPNSDSGSAFLSYSKTAAILAINTIQKRITILAGLVNSGEISIGSTVTISNSDGNNGSYPVVDARFDSEKIELDLSDTGAGQKLTTPRPGFGYMAETGVAIENQRIIFYATPEKYNNEIIGPNTPDPVQKKLLGGISDNDSFFLQLREMLPGLVLHKNAIFTSPLDIITVLSFEENPLDRVPFARSNFMALGVTQSEFTSLKAIIDSTLSDFHNIFLTATPVGTDAEKDQLYNTLYKKYTLGAIGLNNSGVATPVNMPSGSEIYLYSLDELLFTSHDFGELENVKAFSFGLSPGMEFEEEYRQDIVALATFTEDPGLTLLVSNFEDDIEATNDPAVIADHIKTYGKNIYEQALTYQIDNPTELEDRSLYWARLHMRGALRIHPYFTGKQAELKKNIDKLEEYSRGLFDVHFKPVFDITGSTGNDGNYKGKDVKLVGGNTVITVSEDITDATADGQIEYSHYVKITGINIATKEITVLGDYSAELSSSDPLAIAQTAQNNGHYTVDDVMYNGTSTVVTINESISDTTVEGNLVFLRKKAIGAISTFDNKITINEDIVSDLEASTRKILVSGFDPYGLGSSSITDQSNPAGIIGLTLHRKAVKDGVVYGHIQSAGIYPVSWRYFDENFIEKGFEPYLKNAGACDEVFTFSQDGVNNKIQFDRFYARYRGASKGNENKKGVAILPTLDVARYGPAEYHYETQLPFVPMIVKSNADLSKHYTMQVDQGFLPGNTKNDHTPIPSGDPNLDPTTLGSWKTAPTGQVTSGSGSNYMSNEIAYRVARLRANNQPNLHTGHIHVVSSSFNQTDAHNLVSDAQLAIRYSLLYLNR